MSTIVGFDVSMGRSTMVVYSEDKECIFEGILEHSKEGFNWLYRMLNNYSDIKCVFESTGVYSRQLERFMQENGYIYFVLNPFEAKVKLNNTLRVHKTDKADAHKLALLMFKETFHERYESDEIYGQIKVLSRFYDELLDEADRIKNMLHSTLQICFPGIETLFSRLSSPFFLRIIQKFPHPDLVLECSRTVLKNKLQQSTEKTISKNKLLERSEKLLGLAENCYPAVASNHYTCEQATYYARKLEQILAEKDRCVEKMVTMAKALTEYNIISSIPSLGDNTTVRLIAEMGDIKRFPTHKQLNAFAGIDIRRIQSGNSQIKDRINKRGNPHLRNLLFVIIQNMIKNQRLQDNHIVDYYYKQKRHYNKCHKVAIVACMNKLLRTIVFLVQNYTFYDYCLATNHN